MGLVLYALILQGQLDLRVVVERKTRARDTDD